MDLRLYPLQEDDFDKVITLGAAIHGKNYLSQETLSKILHKSQKNGLCCSYVLYDKPRENGKLVGFRLTYAPGSWEPDEWCSTDKWDVDPEKACYLKSNTIATEYSGQGLGPHLLDVSLQTVKDMGGEAAVTHIWMNSPGNSAFKYFSKTGAKLLWIWPTRWKDDFKNEGYLCAVCCRTGAVQPCTCLAAEMILHFGEEENE